jgi:nudix-type nucleoside diphosphatase (YffH/AdpP family)
MPLTLRDSRTLHEGFVKLFSLTFTDDVGQPVFREVVDHGDAVAVLPYDPERKVGMLVRLARAPVVYAGGPAELLEAPAGLIEDEDEADTARREAMEEAGLELHELEHVVRAWASPGTSTERITLFLAPYSAGDRTGRGGGVAEEHEDITVEERPLVDLWRAIGREVADLKTVALLTTLRLRRPELFDS